MKWDLTYLFKTESDFNSALEGINNKIDDLASYKGKLGNLDSFVEYYTKELEMEEKFVRVYQYASLRSDLNKKDQNSLMALQRVFIAYNKLQTALSFEAPELLSLGKEKVMGFINSNESLKQLTFNIEKLFRNNDHILNDSSERLLSNYSRVTKTPDDVYTSLTTGDFMATPVKLSNKETVMVSTTNFNSLIADLDNPKDRKKVFEAVYNFYDEHKNTFASVYNGIVQNDIALAKSRNYKNSLEAHLYGNNIPLDVYYNLVKICNKKSKQVKEYIKFRKKVLGLKSYHTYDRFLSLAKDESKKYTYDEAKELFFKSIDKFPQEFKDNAHEVLRDGFVDVLPQDGKRSGAYSSSVINLHPYILLNFNDTLNDCFTVAHEAGHSIHSMFSCKYQPQATQDYEIFVAEIASTFNEHNLLDYFIKSGNASKNEKIMLLQTALDDIVSTFYRQTLFAEFELEAHTKAENGEPLTHEVLSDIMIKLYKKYYGLNIEKENVKKFVWAYIPHMYHTPFYVYQYATSFAASFKLYNDVKNNVDGAFDRYLGLLKSGGSDYPTNLTKKAGVDFTKLDTFTAVTNRFDELFAELKLVMEEK